MAGLPSKLSSMSVGQQRPWLWRFGVALVWLVGGKLVPWPGMHSGYGLNQQDGCRKNMTNYDLVVG